MRCLRSIPSSDKYHLAHEAAGAAFSSIIVTAVVMVVIVGCRQYRVNDHRFQYQQRNNNNTRAAATARVASSHDGNLHLCITSKDPDNWELGDDDDNDDADADTAAKH